jgi:hypothetical protein
VVAAGIVVIALMTAAFIVGAALGPGSQGNGDRGANAPTTEDGNVSAPTDTGTNNSSLPTNGSRTNQSGSNASDPASSNSSDLTQGNGSTGSNSSDETSDQPTNDRTDAEAGPAVVKINEVEADPPGTDRSGLEWIELFNPTTSPVDLTGWKVSTTHGIKESSTLSGTIGPSELRVVTFDGQFIDNNGDTVQLSDASGRLIDETPSHADTANDGRTWQRVPDGAEGWQFIEQTRGTSNLPVEAPSSSPPMPSESSSPSAAPVSSPPPSTPTSNVPPAAPVNAPPTPAPSSSTPPVTPVSSPPTTTPTNVSNGSNASG